MLSAQRGIRRMGTRKPVARAADAYNRCCARIATVSFKRRSTRPSSRAVWRGPGVKRRRFEDMGAPPCYAATRPLSAVRAGGKSWRDR
jgi:hypothetical protein